MWRPSCGFHVIQPKSRLFANEILRGAEFLTEQERNHIRDVTNHRVAVVEAWIAAGKIAPVNARHLLIMLWAATQFYADFDPAVHCIADTILGGLIPRSFELV